MGASSVWIFKKIDAPRTVIVRGDSSATFLAEQLKVLDTGKWGIKSIKDERFQLVENWLFERSELSRVDIVIDENSGAEVPPPKPAKAIPTAAPKVATAFKKREVQREPELEELNALSVSEIENVDDTSDKYLPPSVSIPELTLVARDELDQRPPLRIAPSAPKEAPPEQDTIASQKTRVSPRFGGEHIVLKENLEEETQNLPNLNLEIASSETISELAKMSAPKKEQAAVATPPPPKTLPQVKKKPVSSTPEDLRKFPRISGRLKVILISGNRSFRSFSKNMSKGGLLLENKIPDTFHGQDCRVILSSPNQKENLEFKARVIKGEGGLATRMEFTMSHATFIKKLEGWMETFQSPRKKAA